jgi:hypothetical protein
LRRTGGRGGGDGAGRLDPVFCLDVTTGDVFQWIKDEKWMIALFAQRPLPQTAPSSQGEIDFF